jgi:hydroxyacylglutathione hydrolase
MMLRSLEVGNMGANCYLVWCEKTGEGVVIDPGADAERIVQIIKDENIKVKNIINTHGHIDHIGANGDVKEATGAGVLIHELDAPALLEPEDNLSLWIGKKVAGPPADGKLRHGDRIKVGETVEFEVIHTPGHTLGGICLKCGNVIFTGDTLFAGSVGRSDFPGGSQRQLLSSIQERLLCFPDDTTIYPGHGPYSTIGYERAHNPFL